MNKDLHVREKLMVDQFVVLKNDLKVKENLRVNGNSILDGNLKLLNLTSPTNISDRGILIINENGVVQKSDYKKLILQMYSPLNFVTCEPGATNYLPTWANGPSKIYVACPDDVKVGIGTNNPSHKLEVVGDGLYRGTLQVNGNVGLGSAPNTFSRFLITNSNRNAAIQINQVGNVKPYSKLILLEYDEPTTRIIDVQNPTLNYSPFLLEANGRMTIHNGTTKTFQLNPDGLLQARAVKVDVFSWPDYVFEPDYALMPLDELKKFIKENKHLPNVPSEQEVKEGIDLGEMNRLLLEKVEQMTLYIIQQDERIQKLEKKVD